jgi:hypothetical protein
VAVHTVFCVQIHEGLWEKKLYKNNVSKNKLQPIDERKMTDTTTENFWKAWIEPVDPPKPIFYRLYYDSQGHPVCYAMDGQQITAM